MSRLLTRLFVRRPAHRCVTPLIPSSFRRLIMPRSVSVPSTAASVGKLASINCSRTSYSREGGRRMRLSGTWRWYTVSAARRLGGATLRKTRLCHRRLQCRRQGVPRRADTSLKDAQLRLRESGGCEKAGLQRCRRGATTLALPCPADAASLAATPCTIARAHDEQASVRRRFSQRACKAFASKQCPCQ